MDEWQSASTNNVVLIIVIILVVIGIIAIIIAVTTSNNSNSTNSNASNSSNAQTENEDEDEDEDDDDVFDGGSPRTNQNPIPVAPVNPTPGQVIPGQVIPGQVIPGQVIPGQVIPAAQINQNGVPQGVPTGQNGAPRACLNCPKPPGGYQPSVLGNLNSVNTIKPAYNHRSDLSGGEIEELPTEEFDLNDSMERNREHRDDFSGDVIEFSGDVIEFSGDVVDLEELAQMEELAPVEDFNHPYSPGSHSGREPESSDGSFRLDLHSEHSEHDGHDHHNHDGHNHDGHNHDGHNHDGHNHDGHNHDGHNHDGHNHDGHNHQQEHKPVHFEPHQPEHKPIAHQPEHKPIVHHQEYKPVQRQPEYKPVVHKPIQHGRKQEHSSESSGSNFNLSSDSSEEIGQRNKGWASFTFAPSQSSDASVASPPKAKPPVPVVPRPSLPQPVKAAPYVPPVVSKVNHNLDQSLSNPASFSSDFSSMTERSGRPSIPLPARPLTSHKAAPVQPPSILKASDLNIKKGPARKAKGPSHPFPGHPPRAGPF